MFVLFDIFDHLNLEIITISEIVSIVVKFNRNSTCNGRVRI